METDPDGFWLRSSENDSNTVYYGFTGNLMNYLETFSSPAGEPGSYWKAGYIDCQSLTSTIKYPSGLMPLPGQSSDMWLKRQSIPDPSLVGTTSALDAHSVTFDPLPLRDGHLGKLPSAKLGTANPIIIAWTAMMMILANRGPCLMMRGSLAFPKKQKDDDDVGQLVWLVMHEPKR